MVRLAPVSKTNIATLPFTLPWTTIRDCTVRKGILTAPECAGLGTGVKRSNKRANARESARGRRGCRGTHALTSRRASKMVGRPEVVERSARLLDVFKLSFQEMAGG